METVALKLEALSEEQLEREGQRNQLNLKRLYLKLHALSLTIAETEEETRYYESVWEGRKAADFHEVLLSEHLTNLALQLAEAERRNIELEERCLSMPKKEGMPELLKTLNDEMLSKIQEENEVNKKLGNYLGNKLAHSQSQQIEELRQQIARLAKSIQREIAAIQECENRETEVVQNISVLQRLLQEKEAK